MNIEVQVNCKDPRRHKDEVTAAINEFKKRVKKAGLMQELRSREEYVAPSKKRRMKSEAARKQRKRDERKAAYRKES